MAVGRAELLTEALNTFLGSSPDVEAAAVVSFDGLTMSSALPEEMEEDQVGAMSAALLALGEQAARGLGRGQLQQLFVEADEGYVFLMSAQDQAVLVAVTGRQAKLGLILFEMRRVAWDIGGLLDEPVPLAFAEEAVQQDEPGPAADEPVRAGSPLDLDPAFDPEPYGGPEDEPYFAASNGRTALYPEDA